MIPPFPYPTLFRSARYLLDPRRKHSPTLLDDNASKRVDFLKRAIDIAADLNAEAVSFWAGVRPADIDEQTSWDRLKSGCAQVAEHAETRGVKLGFEPEPGMLVESIDQWAELKSSLGDGFGLTLDIGHCRAVEPYSVADCVRRAGPHLVNVQIDDMRRGVHEHLEFGEGEIDFPPVLRALKEVGYTGLVAVELPRHSHAAPEVAARSLTFLRASEWLAEAVDRVRGDPGSIGALFPAVGRHTGRALADSARVRLLQASGLPDDELVALYRYGDNDEKRAILLALPALRAVQGTDLLRDALRSNDSRLVAAALGPAGEDLPDAEWRQGVLKGVFMGLPLAGVHGLNERADAELGRMLDGLRKEREAAGRTMPADAVSLLERLV
ncbi:MAG TPA: sugar phosphate isomerase/epimerase [Micromonosporaceae bacterium]|nr:sugar phosphate isomerase/epimerase [Micromonosporaceae bacterium]